MKNYLILFMVLTCLCCSGCYYSGINGKVIDNATGRPIEGALVVAQWTKPRGIPGLQYHNLHKIEETLTNKDGTFSLKGTFGILIDPPQMLIYKEGYVPLRNDSVFPSLNKVKENEWVNNEFYRLNTANTKFSHHEMHLFINTGMIGIADAPIFHKIDNELFTRALNENKNK